MKQVNRILIWLVILVSPTTLWFFFTDDGSNAWQQISNKQVKTELKPISFKNHKSEKNIITLIPAAPPATKPRLRISVTYNQSQSTNFPFTVYVEDMNQNKIGYDNSTQQITSQINNAKLNISGQTIAIDIHPATSTKYSLNVSGNPGGYFRLAIGGVSPTMASSTTILEGNAPNNRTLHYNINLNQLRSIGFGTQMRQSTTSQFISQPISTVTHYKQVSLKDTCLNFFKKMKQVPDGYVEVSAGNECDITFHGKSRNNSFVSPEELFYPYDNNRLSADGWTPSMEADGPDGSYFQITNNSINCQVSGNWDGGLDDDPSYTPGNNYSISISCSENAVRDP